MPKQNFVDQFFDDLFDDMFGVKSKSSPNKGVHRQRGDTHHTVYRSNGGKMSWDSTKGSYSGGGHSRSKGRQENKKWK